MGLDMLQAPITECHGGHIVSNAPPGHPVQVWSNTDLFHVFCENPPTIPKRLSVAEKRKLTLAHSNRNAIQLVSQHAARLRAL